MMIRDKILRPAFRFIGLVGILLPACQISTTTSTPPENEAATPIPLPIAVTFSPSIAVPGQTVTIGVSGVSTSFSASTEMTLGEDVQINSLVVSSESELAGEMTVGADAKPGYRTLFISDGESLITQENALLIQSGTLVIAPNRGNRGESIDIAVDVTGMTITPGYTWITFGEGVTTESFVVDEETPSRGTARVRIDSEASPGSRDVSIEDGPTRIMLPEGFLVDRGLVAIDFSPAIIQQGEQVTFSVIGYGTHFEQGMTRVELDGGLLVLDDETTSLTVQSPTSIQGTLKACDAALVGFHSVTVTTERSSGTPEIVSARDEVEVEEIPITVEVGYCSISWFLSRFMRDGEVSEEVSASASFIGIVESCTTGSSSSSTSSCTVQTLPYDSPSYYPPAGCDQSQTSSSGTVQSVPVPTLDAGDAIFFMLNDVVMVQLDKVVESDGTIRYENSLSIPLDAFVFDQDFDVYVPGGVGAEAVPEFTAEGVLITPPSDFLVDSPDLLYAPTLDRYDSVQVRWSTPEGKPGADTFPVGSMYSRLRTVDGSTGYASEIRVIPDDDGEYIYPAEYVSQLYAGSGRFTLQATRIGPGFLIPGSIYTSQAFTALAWDGYFELR